MNDENLIPVRTSEEASIKGRAGGLKSVEARRRKRDFKRTLEILLELPADKGKKTDIEKLKAINKNVIMDSNLTQNDLICIAMVNEAKKGSVPAAVWIRDQLGEKPTERTEVNLTGDIDLDNADIDELLQYARTMQNKKGAKE